MVRSFDSHISDYLAGASMIFGIILAADQVLSFFYGYSSFVGSGETRGEMVLLSVVLHTMRALLGGYLVGRRTPAHYVQAATVVAVIVYIFESIYLRMFAGSLGDVWSLLSLFIGGILGSMFAKIQKERTTLVSDAKNTTL